VGTICNLKCIHCGTGASSKWQEDKSLLGKYPNTENYRIDNKWIEQDSLIWDSMRTGIAHTRKMNFLGGEPFANKQHNRFVREIAETGHAAHITLSYVTNGLLIDDAMVQTLLKFKNVIMRVSIDAAGLPGEYFRYPMRWARFVSQLEMLSRYARDNDNIDLGLQWTCSNISMFYLVDTHVEMRKLFPELRLLLCNHVEWPQHMSAQVLPQDIKRGIAAQISAHDWGNDATAVSFYVNHMLAEDMWLDHGHVLLNYLDDLDRARSTDWHSSFADMRLEDHDRR